MSRENIWHSSHLQKRRTAFCNKIDEYFKDEVYTDVNIICEDRKFKCHRLVLAAASEYFHLMFKGNFSESRLEEVVLHDFDSATFEQIILFVYRGEMVTIDDSNIFNLLRASDILQLSDLEDQCVHYLTQKNIPMYCALEIYLFVSALRKVALIPATSQFILQHLDRFSQESKFLEMSFEDFSALLTYFQSSSTSRDRRLMKAILVWVCRLTDDCENRKSSFMKLVLKAQFEFISAAHAAEYFDQNAVDSNDKSRHLEISETSDTNSSVEIDGLSSLHVYIETGVKDDESIFSDDYDDEFNDNDDNDDNDDSEVDDYDDDDNDDSEVDDYDDDDDDDSEVDDYNDDDHRVNFIAKQISIFSLKENAGNGTGDWHHSHTVRPAFEKMRIVESDDRLYCLKFHNYRYTAFSSSTAFDLCTNEQSLALPSPLISIDPFALLRGSMSLCCLRKKIYLNASRNNDFQCYDTEMGKWSPVPIFNEYKQTVLVNDDSRLYMVDKRSSFTDHSPFFAAYDPRIGGIEELNSDGLDGITSFYQPGCYHRGRIYLLDDAEFLPSFRMAIYDIVAGRWELQTSKSDYATLKGNRRLVSFNNRLCMLGLLDDSIFTHIYDSYVQEWNGIHSQKLCDALPDSKLQLMYFTDVLAFKSS